MVHQERNDLIHPDKCPSPLSSSDALAFGDTLESRSEFEVTYPPLKHSRIEGPHGPCWYPETPSFRASGSCE